MAKNDGTIIIEDARIIYRNFSGVEGPFNQAGTRTFNVLLEPDIAKQLEEDGWNVKYLKPRAEDEEEGTEPQAHMQVVARYDKGRPPRVVLITSRNRTNLDEETVECLDDADIKTIDMIIRPYHWDVRGESGIKAYLKTMFVTIQEDYLELKYAEELDELPSRSGRIDE